MLQQVLINTPSQERCLLPVPPGTKPCCCSSAVSSQQNPASIQGACSFLGQRIFSRKSNGIFNVKPWVWCWFKPGAQVSSGNRSFFPPAISISVTLWPDGGGVILSCLIGYCSLLLLFQRFLCLLIKCKAKRETQTAAVTKSYFSLTVYSRLKYLTDSSWWKSYSHYSWKYPWVWNWDLPIFESRGGSSLCELLPSRKESLFTHISYNRLMFQ